MFLTLDWVPYYHVFGEALQVSQSDDNYFIVLSSRSISFPTQHLQKIFSRPTFTFFAQNKLFLANFHFFTFASMRLPLANFCLKLHFLIKKSIFSFLRFLFLQEEQYAQWKVSRGRWRRRWSRSRGGRRRGRRVTTWQHSFPNTRTRRSPPCHQPTNHIAGYLGLRSKKSQTLRHFTVFLRVLWRKVFLLHHVLISMLSVLQCGQNVNTRQCVRL